MNNEAYETFKIINQIHKTTTNFVLRGVFFFFLTPIMRVHAIYGAYLVTLVGLSGCFWKLFATTVGYKTRPNETTLPMPKPHLDM